MEPYNARNWSAHYPRPASQSRGSRRREPFDSQPVYQCRSPPRSLSSVSRPSVSRSSVSHSSVSNSSASETSTPDSSTPDSSAPSTPPSTPSPFSPIDSREDTEEGKRKKEEEEAEENMPCCFAQLDFKACGHGTLIKLACGDPTCRQVCGGSSSSSSSSSSGGGGVSPPGTEENKVKRRSMLVVARIEHLWNCAACHEAERREETTVRDEEHRIWMSMIVRRERLASARQRRASIRFANAQRRAGFERRDAAQRTGEMHREKEAVRQWARDYGLALCQARFGGSAQRREDGIAGERSAMLRKPWDVFVRSNILSSSEMLRARQSGGMPACLEYMRDRPAPTPVNKYPAPKKGDA